tara:strand:+ start:25 stop:921 length:897 start_codon:yes stop_codon:yes gene_type:complete
MKAINKFNKQIKFTEPFKNLFTQGMVCHETYKDTSGNWLYPEEIEKKNEKKAIKRSDGSKVKIGPPESMSKSKKNTIDPEKMIQQYGADSVRWFILSDSPPEKDVQWSDAGVISSSKFLQRIWNLNYEILKSDDSAGNEQSNLSFVKKIDLYVYKIDKAINSFQFNVAIAQFYEVYKYLNDSVKQQINKKKLIENLTKIMKLMVPLTPHLANECLTKLGCLELNRWPLINEKILNNIEINLVVQINGRTRDVLNIEQDLEEKKVDKLVKNSPKVIKHLENKKILKTVYIKNKIINYII